MGKKDLPLIAGICGSLRPDGYTAKVLNLALQGASEMGTRTKFIDLRNVQLEFCDGMGNNASPSEDLVDLRETMQRAQGIIWATPEYHGSFSGVLKNALDLMGSQEFKGKIIGLVGVAGGDMGAVNALNGLRMVGRSLGSWVIPHQASVASVYKAFNQEGELQDPKLANRIKEVGKHVARFAYLHHSKDAKDFMDLWEASLAEE